MKNFLNYAKQINEEHDANDGVSHGALIGRTHIGLKHLKYSIIKDSTQEHSWHLKDESGKIVVSVEGDSHSAAMSALKAEGYDV